MLNDLFYKENEYKIKKAMDDIFLKMLPKGYIEIDVDQLIARDTLEKCGYFDKNPNYLECVMPVSANQLDNVMRNKTISKKDLADEKMLFLSPAACLNVYPIFKNEIIEQNFCITIKANVFRNENYTRQGIRHNQFCVRELIFIGEEKYVFEQLDRIRKEVIVYAKKITPLSNIKQAVDCFYPSTIKTVLEKYQKAHKSKQELIIPIEDSEVACASFNYHGKEFSKIFNFDNNGKIVSGCIGFGFERLINAYIYHRCNFING